MWLLPTRGRPDLCQQALDACAATNMTSRGVVMIDVRAGDYRLHAPNNWEVMRGTWDMADCMRHVYYVWPDEQCYGWLSDDLRPKTEGWDKTLEAAAGDWAIAHCRDLCLSEHLHSRERNMCGAMCWGGDLIRAVGWWAPNFTRQGGIDDTWVHLWRNKLNNQLAYCADVLVEHISWRNGKREPDATDNHVRDGVDYIAQDFAAMRAYWDSVEFADIVSRLERIKTGGAV